MKIEPSIIEGPAICPECEDYCDHERTMQYFAIYWQEDSGREWGDTALVSLPVSDAMKETLERALWRRYREWVEDEGKDEAGALDSTC